jgi:GTP cyclohydrolase II
LWQNDVIQKANRLTASINLENHMQLKRVAEAKLPTPWGDFLMVGFEELATGQDHVALVFGDISGQLPVLARVHSECLTGDALFSLRCDCGFQLKRH